MVEGWYRFWATRWRRRAPRSDRIAPFRVKVKRLQRQPSAAAGGRSVTAAGPDLTRSAALSVARAAV
jgi:hypothetical protein